MPRPALLGRVLLPIVMMSLSLQPRGCRADLEYAAGWGETSAAGTAGVNDSWVNLQFQVGTEVGATVIPPASSHSPC